MKKELTELDFMQIAINEAKIAFKKGEVPVGAVVVKNGRVLAKAHNEKEMKKDTTRHAEIVAIQRASKKLKDWRLNGCTMFVTLEPCCMCVGAILNCRISNVVFGASEERFGCVVSAENLLNSQKLNSNVNIKVGILENECKELLQEFFKNKRETKGSRKR